MRSAAPRCVHDGPSQPPGIPQGIAFQPGTGQAFAIEHAHYVDHASGVSSHATVMRLEAGGNYSWPNGSGFGYKVPAWQSRDNPYVATAGGSVVSNAKWGAWGGNLFIGTLAGTMLLRLAPNPTEPGRPRRRCTSGRTAASAA